MTGANIVLLFPILAIPMIFGGLRSRRLRDLSPLVEVTSPVPSSSTRTPCYKRHACYLLGFSDMVKVYPMLDMHDHCHVDLQVEDCPPEMEPFLEREDRQIPPAVMFAESTPLQCLRSQEFWLLFVTSAITSGCGLTLLNNLAQMVRCALQQSLSGHALFTGPLYARQTERISLYGFIPRLKDFWTTQVEALRGSGSTAVFVSVFSITNCLGRLCSGYRFTPTQRLPLDLVCGCHNVRV